MVGTAEATEPEHYFYHSFPRPRKSRTNEKGLKILESITDFGLVLAPEVTRWEYPHASGAPPRKMEMVQRRVCFTELAPKDLPKHAEEFGPFALEFDIDALKAQNALPVFYIPKGTPAVSSLGQTLVIQIVDAMCLIDRMAQVKHFIDTTTTSGSRQNFEFGSSDRKRLFSLDVDEAARSIEGIGYAVTPPEMLSLALEGALNFFYPADADDTRENSTLKYYRQREWRIAGNIGRMGKDLMGLPPQSLIDRLLDIDPEFYGKEFPKPEVVLTNPSLKNQVFGERLVDWVYVYQGIDDRHIVGAARRVIVPRDAIDRATKILSKHPNAPSVVAIEDIV
ncbi:MAG: hypothetical protein ACLQME_24780 [Alphaproteobacteria bacterium]